MTVFLYNEVMKILMYCWDSSIEHIVSEQLIKKGHEIVFCHKACKDYVKDMELAWEMIQLIQKHKVEAVFSLNYFPIISSVCETAQIIYYAWVYDNPHFTLFADQAKLSCNRIFLFDKSMANRLRELGVTNAYHLPLAVDVDFFEKQICLSKEKERFHADISFVGSFYTDSYDYFELLKTLPQSEKEYFCQSEKLITEGSFLYGKAYQVYLDRLLGRDETWKLFDFIEKITAVKLGAGYFAEQSDVILPAVLEKRMTILERKKLMCAVAEKDWDFKVYTNSDLLDYPHQLREANQGIVDYESQMPLVFHESRINLNLSLRSIHTGIPLRVLDIMACGGFVLSNRQPEIEEYFEIDREIVVFDSLEDCMEKIEYYLSHEEERAQIAKAGQEKVRKVFSYEHMLEKIFM